MMPSGIAMGILNPVRALVRRFEQRCGATICKELKGVATGVPLCPCPECVRNAVLALGDVLPDAVKE